jgi:hypothetical protein
VTVRYPSGMGLAIVDSFTEVSALLPRFQLYRRVADTGRCPPTRLPLTL